MELDGKIALVTGAAQGLGRGFSEILLQNGAKVALLDLNEAVGKSLKETFDKQFGPERTLFLTCNVESEEQLKDGIRGRGFSEILLQNGAKVALLDLNEAVGKSLKETFDKQFGPERTLFLTCNVESEEQLKAAFRKTIETFGQLDIVCNNAGISDEKDWEKTISINLTSVVRGTYLALEHMNKLTGGHGGVIINTASMAGLGPLLSVPVYTATKHGVVGFTRAMADASKVSGYGVRFNALCPAFVRTDIINDMTQKSGQFSHLQGATQKVMEEFGMLEVPEVAKNFLQLVKDETRNGEVLMVLTKGSQYMTFPDVQKILQGPFLQSFPE